MPLSREDILAYPALPVALRQLAQTFLGVQQAQPRMAAIFGTQQRWLLAQLALAHYFRGIAKSSEFGLQSSHFLDSAVEMEIASRNTARAFMNEMLHYGFAQHIPSADKRFRLMVLMSESIKGIDNWIMVHLVALDAIDQGNRLARYCSTPEAVVRVQPPIADLLIQSSAVRAPQTTFSLFTWLNQGGLLMDSLIAGLEQEAADPERIRTAIDSTQDIAARLRLSRTHLSRKLREAEDLGSIGWTGARGRSTLWVSPTFCAEYYGYQAVKLAIIDASFAAAGI